MALKGTLKDFGIADILQLIGQQQKTGTLHLKSKDQEVDIGFKDGNIVKAESSTRKKKDLIGAMLVRAELITEQQLESALDTQKRSLKRLGDVLVSGRMLTAERFRAMVQLQATETLYHLFTWKNGTYEFEQGDVEFDPESLAPLRAESVLMEGFRMVDEWPVIKKTITRYDMTFETLRPLPPPRQQEDSFDAALDDAFAEKKKDENQGEFKSIGDSERKLYELIKPGRDVRKLVDIALVGEFETCKALCNLVNLQYAKAIEPKGRAASLDASAPMSEQISGAVGRLVVTMGVLLAVGLLVSRMDLDSVSLFNSPSSSYADPAAQRFISKTQMGRIEKALDVYQLEAGDVPDSLDTLVAAGLLAREDLRYPWRDVYYYRRTAPRQFVLLPPLR